MSKSIFHQAEEIFHAALELSGSQKESFIASATAGNAELEQLVLGLVQEAEGAEHFFDSRMGSVLHAVSTPEPGREGDRIGPYRLERLIGVGGMGSVFLAIRADGEFRQQVAIKVASSHSASAWGQERLRYERQVLAQLKHPNIASLLDGGSTQTGLPYLVMEYIEGEPLLEHCRRRHLGVEDRLRLFLGVCEAVTFAHRNLVIHRDLKPANILVTADGVPKLLDFGISKLLDPLQGEEGGVQATTMIAMTPAYASPEQVRYETITTQSDVYSLGVLLFELLTEKCPFETRGLAPAAIERLICDEPSPKPSSLNRPDLAGDLDNVAGMAMRKEPDRRYAGVEQLAEDVRRYLENRPLVARQEEKLYRFRKFVRRHRVAVSAGAVMLVLIVAGFSAAIWYGTQLARQVALMERQFVHFGDMSRRMLIEFPNRIQGAKSVQEVRQIYVEESLDYIDRLAPEAARDARLTREVARAYQVIGDVQGFAHQGSLMRPADAIRTYQKGIALLEPLDRAGRAGVPELVLLARMSCAAGRSLERSGGSAADQRKLFSDCVRYAERAVDRSPGYVFVLSRGYSALGDFEWSAGNRQAAVAAYQANLDAVQRHGSRLAKGYDYVFAEAELRGARSRLHAGDDWGAHASFQRSIAIAQNGTTPSHRHVELAALVELTQHAQRLQSRYRKGPDVAALVARTRRLAAELSEPAVRHPAIHPLLAIASQIR